MTARGSCVRKTNEVFCEQERFSTSGGDVLLKSCEKWCGGNWSPSSTLFQGVGRGVVVESRKLRERNLAAVPKPFTFFLVQQPPVIICTSYGRVNSSQAKITHRVLLFCFCSCVVPLRFSLFLSSLSCSLCQ